MPAVLLLGVLASGCTHLVWYGRSADRRHVAAVIERGGAQLVRHDLRDGPPFKGIGVDGVRLDGARLAYPAQRDDGAWVVMYGSRASAPFDGVGEVLLEGGALVFAAERGGKWFVVSGDRESGPWDEVVPGTLRWWAPMSRCPPECHGLSRSSPLLSEGAAVFVARRGGRTWVVVGAREHGPFESAGQLSFWRSSVAFVARTAEGVGIYLGTGDGPIGLPTRGAWDELAEVRLEDGLPFFAQHDASGWRVFYGGFGPTFDRVAGLQRVAGEVLYAGRRKDGEYVVHGQKLHGPFRALKRQLFVAGAGLVFAAKRDDGWFVQRGDSPSGPWDDVTGLVAAGAHDAFVGERDGRSVVVVDGVEQRSWELAAGLTLHDSGRVLYVARPGAQTLLVDGERTTPFDLLLADTLAFTPDGAHFGAVTGEAKTRRLFITFDDGARVPLDLEELTAALTRVPPEALLTSPDRELMRRWVEAELAIHFSAGKKD